MKESIKHSPRGSYSGFEATRKGQWLSNGKIYQKAQFWYKTYGAFCIFHFDVNCNFLALELKKE